MYRVGRVKLCSVTACITEKIKTHSFNGFTSYAKNYVIKIVRLNICAIENCYICRV